MSKTTFFRFDGGWRKFGSSENATTKHTSCLTQLKAACTISRISDGPIFFNRPFRTDLIVSLSMGVQANILVKIYFRENVVVTKNLSTRLGQQSTQLQFGMLFIIMQNLEIFCGGIFR